MVSEISRCWVCPAAIRTGGEVNGENPAACTVTVYWPGVKPGIAYWPVASDVPMRLAPVVDVTVSEAWGMTAPLGSATWPRRAPVTATVAVCAKAYGRAKKNRVERQRANKRFNSSPQKRKVK